MKRTTDKRRGRSRPERASVSVSAATLANLDAEATRRGVTRYELTNQILGQLADELGAELPEKSDGGWIKGPPPGRGRWWVVWTTLQGETRVDVIEVSPALIHYHDPNARLLFKTLTGAAYQFAPNEDVFTHHMPLTEPEMPR